MSRNNSSLPKRVNPENLSRMVAQLARNRRRVSKNSFKSVLKDCSNKIIQTAKYSKDEFIVYVVPSFMLGHPVFNRTDCVNYIRNYMTRMKMPTAVIPPYTLCISWNSKIDVSKVIELYVPKSETQPKPRPSTVRKLAHFERISKAPIKSRPKSPIHIPEKLLTIMARS